MAVSNIRAVFSCEIETVWETVASLEHYSWRSDLDRIEVRSGHEFVEYTRDGFSTAFTVTAKEPMRRLEFDMENVNMKGHWTGLFSSRKDQTVIDFTEDVTAKKLFMKPFVGMFLKKQQAAYIEDLRKVLEG